MQKSVNELAIFKNADFGQLRTIDIEGKIHFAAKDIAKALGYKDTINAIKQHCRGVVKHHGVSFTTNQHGKTTQQTVEMNFIPEGDVYRLIAHSQLPAAVKFEAWVFDEVLPSVITKGGYINLQSDTSLLVRTVVEQTAAAIIAQMPMLIGETVKAVFSGMADNSSNKSTVSEAPTKPQKAKHLFYHTKIDKLPKEIRNEVIAMMFEKDYTLVQISDTLKKEGYDIHFTNIGTYHRRLLEELGRLDGIEIQR